MARASRCSAARSTSPNPRSTSCVSCARSPTARFTPPEAVKDYHDALQKQGLKPARELAADSAITESVLKSA